MWKHASQPACILVVDDEAAVRATITRTLASNGYEVIEAVDGLEGLAVLESGRRVDLVVADLEMPELSGAEMVRRIRGPRPDLKILYVTGFIDSLMDSRSLWEGEAFLEKPFTLIGLQEAVSMLMYGSLAPPAPSAGFGRIAQWSRRLGLLS